MDLDRRDLANFGLILYFACVDVWANDSDVVDAKLLMQARESLLVYAHSYNFRQSSTRKSWQGWYGFLPCPDMRTQGRSGVADGTCGKKNYAAVGVFPWKTLGIDKPQHRWGACLNYAVSGVFKNGSTTRTDELNERVIPQLTVSGQPVAAVIWMSNVDCEDASQGYALSQRLDLSFDGDELWRFISVKDVFGFVRNTQFFKAEKVLLQRAIDQCEQKEQWDSSDIESCGIQLVDGKMMDFTDKDSLIRRWWQHRAHEFEIDF